MAILYDHKLKTNVRYAVTKIAGKSTRYRIAWAIKDRITDGITLLLALKLPINTR